MCNGQIYFPRSNRNEYLTNSIFNLEKIYIFNLEKIYPPIKKFLIIPHVRTFIDVICVTGGASKIKRTLRPDVGWFFQQYSIFIYKIVIVSKLRYYQLGGGGFVST